MTTTIATPIYSIPKPITSNSGFINTGIQLLKNDSDWTMFLDCIPNIDSGPQAVIHCVDEMGTYPGVSFSFENGYINFYNGESGTTIGNGNYLNKNIKVVIVKKGTDIIIYHNDDDSVYQVDSPITIPYTFKSVNSTLSIGGGHLGAAAIHAFSGVINNFILYNEALEDQECKSIINNGSLLDMDSPIYQIPAPITFSNSGHIDTGIQLLKNDSNWTMFLDCIPNIDNKTQTVIHCIDEMGTYPGVSFSFEPNGKIALWNGTSGTVIGDGNYLNKNIKVVIVKKDSDIIIYHNNNPIYQMDSPITIPYTFKSVNSTLSISGGHKGERSMYSFSGTINNFILYNEALEDQECNYIIDNNGLLPEFNDEFTKIRIGDIIASALYLGDIKINSCYLGDQKIL